ncbi:ATP-grasp domain-containing protein [Evansella sp. AB-rgal1]|uniref:ATP-grasp domain-containing protein n=1 Tax=Evansella sp. AB-rgal1 TaxID=3242696 RepID=UPI00359EECD9
MSNNMLFIYNHVSKENMTEDLKECASIQTVTSLLQSLESHSFHIISVNLMDEIQLEEIIQAHSPIVGAFVIAEGFLAQPHTLYDGSGALSIRKILERYEIPYTHSTPKTMEACRNKDLTYKVLKDANILIPKFISFPSPVCTEDQLAEAEAVVGYPMFVKPTGGGNSLGIDEMSICRNRSDLTRKLLQLKLLIDDQPILIETFLSGSEYTVAVLGNEDAYVLPVIEFPNDVDVRSHAVKAMEYEKRDSFILLPTYEGKGMDIAKIAMKVFRGLQGKDLIRLDLKTDDFGNLYVIDVNGTPSLSIKGSVSYMISTLGITMDELVGFMLHEIISETFINDSVKHAWDAVKNKLVNPTQLVVA